MLLLADLTERGGKEQEKWISAINLCECLACLTSLTFQFNDQREKLANRWPVPQSLSSFFPLVCLCPCGISPYGYLVPVMLVLRVHRGEWRGLEAAISKANVTTQLRLYFLYCCCSSFSTTEDCRGEDNKQTKTTTTNKKKTQSLHSPLVMGQMGIQIPHQVQFVIIRNSHLLLI